MAQEQLQNRQLRTRKDLLQAASRLLKLGRAPTMEEVAQEALVSRATAYRYFSDVDELLLEVTVDETVPPAEELFDGQSHQSLVERIDQAESVMHDYSYRNEDQLRLLLAKHIAKPRSDKSSSTPRRQSRRTQYITEAIAPYRDQFDGPTLKLLIESLALVFGPEAMIVFQDVVPLKPARAKEVKRWMMTSLVNVALQESKPAKQKVNRGPKATQSKSKRTSKKDS